MLFWIILVLAIAAFAWVVWDEFNVVAVILAALMSIVLLVSLAFVVDGNTRIDAKIDSNQTIYESLVYQYENNLYDNDNDVGKYELMQRIEDWNSDLAYYRAVQDDFWVGIYYPNIFDQFEFIELE